MCSLSERKLFVQKIRRNYIVHMLLLILLFAFLCTIGLIVKIRVFSSSRTTQVTVNEQTQKQPTYNLVDLRPPDEDIKELLGPYKENQKSISIMAGKLNSYLSNEFKRLDTLEVILYNMKDRTICKCSRLPRSGDPIEKTCTNVIMCYLFSDSPISIQEDVSLSILNRFKSKEPAAEDWVIELPKDHFDYICKLSQAHFFVLRILDLNYYKTTHKTEYSLLLTMQRFFFRLTACFRGTISISKFVGDEETPHKYLNDCIYIVIEEHIFSCDKLENKNAVNFCKDVKESKELERLNYFIFENFYKIFGMFRVKTITPEYLKYVEDVNKHSEEFYNEMIKIFVKYK